MSGKRGRKCSMKYCDSYQHTHKHLSFFRFPKDPVRCKVWIEKSERPELLEKVNVHEERVCERHFEPQMFLNDYRNRLHQSAVPILCLKDEPEPMRISSLPTNLPISMISDSKILNIRKAELQRAADLYQNQLLSYITSPSDKSLNLSTNSAGSPIVSNQIKKSPTITPTSVASPSSSIGTLPNTQNPGYKRPRQIFTLQQEEQLAVYVRDTANYYSGLSSKEVRILAFVYGVCNRVDMPAGWHETHQASFDWCLGFIKRNKLAPMILSGYSNGKSRPNVQVQSPPPPPPITNSIVSNNTTNISKNSINGNQNDVTPIEIDG